MGMFGKEGARNELSSWFYDLGVGIIAAIMMVYVNQTNAIDVMWAMVFGIALFILGVILEEPRLGSYMKKKFPDSLRRLGIFHTFNRYMIDLGSGILISGSVLYIQKNDTMAIGFGVLALISLGIAWYLDKTVDRKIAQ